MSTVSEMYVWASVGSSSAPPERIRTEVCADCAALVPVAAFDVHGRWHAALERNSVTTAAQPDTISITTAVQGGPHGSR